MGRSLKVVLLKQTNMKLLELALLILGVAYVSCEAAANAVAKADAEADPWYGYNGGQYGYKPYYGYHRYGYGYWGRKKREAEAEPTAAAEAEAEADPWYGYYGGHYGYRPYYGYHRYGYGY